MEAIGALSVTAGHEGADEDMGGAFHGLML